MKIIGLAMGFALGMIELAALEGGLGGWIGEMSRHFRRCEAGKLPKELDATVANLLGEIRFMIGEVEKRTRCREFLSLKQHRCAGSEQQQGRHGAKFPGSGEEVTT